MALGSVWARLKSGAGGKTIPNPAVGPVGAVTSAIDLNITENSNVITLVPSTTLAYSTINANQRVMPGRIVTFIGSGSNTVTFTNNAASTTKGQIDNGAAGDATLAATDVFQCIQQNNGVWLGIVEKDN